MRSSFLWMSKENGSWDGSYSWYEVNILWLAYVRRIVVSFVSISSETWMLEGQQADLLSAQWHSLTRKSLCDVPFFLSFCSYCTAWGILVPPPGLNLGPVQWKQGPHELWLPKLQRVHGHCCPDTLPQLTSRTRWCWPERHLVSLVLKAVEQRRILL